MATLVPAELLTTRPVGAIQLEPDQRVAAVARDAAAFGHLLDKVEAQSESRGVWNPGRAGRVPLLLSRRP